MAWWRRWLETFFLRRLRDLWQRNPPDAGARTDREAALTRMLEETRAELARWKDGDARRGRVFQKLRRRLDTLKRARKISREELRTMKRELAEREREIASRGVEMAALLRDNAIRDAFSEANLGRPGLQALTPPDMNVERRIRKHLRFCVRVWKYPMRLGVLHQHGPRPIMREKFPNAAPPARWPVISVVTPSFQQAAFLERTMRSVLGQDYPRLEYFVADGGSTDGSVEIIRRHAASLAGWLSESDGGAAHAANKGFGRSRGEIMAWLNSDDLWMPGVARFVAAWFEAHPDVDVVYGHRVVVDERDKEVGHWTLPRHDGEMLLWADFVPQETMFWRRRIWEKSGGALDESFRFAFDWDLLLRFQRAGARIVRLPRFMGCFRMHLAQKSSAEIGTVGLGEMARLRARELGASFSEHVLEMRVVRFQWRAIWCDRLLRAGLRW